MYIFDTEQVYLFGRKVVKREKANCQSCSLYDICLSFTIKRPNLSWLLYKCFDPNKIVGYNFQEI